MKVEATEGKTKLQLVSRNDGYFVAKDEAGKRFLVKNCKRLMIEYVNEGKSFILVDNSIIFGVEADRKVNQ